MLALPLVGMKKQVQQMLHCVGYVTDQRQVKIHEIFACIIHHNLFIYIRES